MAGVQFPTYQSLRKTMQRFSANVKRISVKRLLFDNSCLGIMAGILLLCEIVLNVAIVNFVNYTEIDWKAYMQEVEGVVNGTYDYYQLKGDTGPLVYPAGFVYVFTILYYLTEYGKNIKIAQYIFAGFYIIVLLLVFRIYTKTKKVPPYVLAFLCCTSYRIHSVFVLRMFNDPVAMMFLYAALNLFLDSRWTAGSFFYSCAVSIKMNILLFAPALLMAYLTSLGIQGTIIQLAVCAAVQVVLALPFLLANPVAYVMRAFDFGRVFLFEWTVNWRFIPEWLFVDWKFHVLLLAIHAALLLAFYSYWKVCLQSYARMKCVEIDLESKMKKSKHKIDMSVTSRLLLLPLFTANFLGIACSRSLHYQFYVWYSHSLPYLLWSAPYSNKFRLCLLGIIELCWNVFPSTSISSISLHICHLVILYGLYINREMPTKK
ncbi:lethal(2)neighbour of tid protein [Ischnura elegans]|uniref:lethal(2)neighbour of tid protein n=1 Tax=Ischnura elegans TaxID=197161 RepID=UPI001ED8865D|nr:lethal(2)neighbour of tid protein [Ischnura elegans]